MGQRLRKIALPWMIAAVALITALAAGIAYAANPTESRPGPPAAYAEIHGDGTLVVEDTGPDVNLPRARNITQANISHPATGVYCFSGLSVEPRNAVVSGSNGGGQNFTLATVEINPPGLLVGCGPNDTVRVRTIDVRTQVLTDVSFFIWFED